MERYLEGKNERNPEKIKIIRFRKGGRRERKKE